MKSADTGIDHQSVAEPSKLFSVVLEPGWLTRISVGQQSGTSLSACRTLAENLESDAFEYKTFEDQRVLYRKSKNILQLVISATGGFRELLLQELHACRVAGHLGIRKTIYALCVRVWWPEMLHTVKHFVNSCQVC